MSSGARGLRSDASLSWLILAILAVSTVAAVAIVVAALANTSSPSYGWGMMGGWGSGGAWMVVAALMMVVPLAIVILVVYLLARAAGTPPVVRVASAIEDPIAVLQIRYARGEISGEQYQQMGRILRQG